MKHAVRLESTKEVCGVFSAAPQANLVSFIYLFSKYLLSIYTMILSKRSAALLMVITNNKN